MRASEKTVKKKHLNHVAKKEGNNAGFVQVISELPGPSVQEMLKDEEFHPKTLISVERAVRMFSSFSYFFRGRRLHVMVQPEQYKSYSGYVGGHIGGSSF